MKTIAFFSQKGGSGKTTLAVHTAVAAMASGRTVAVIDTDPQQSAMLWGSTRTLPTPVVVAGSPANLERILEAAENDGISLCIVDTAPHAAPDAARIARMVDFIVIPCRPTAFDIAAVHGAVTIAQAAKTPAGLVLSACPARAVEIEETRLAISGYGFPVIPGEVTERRAFSRAVASGRAVTEFEPSGKAASEIRQLWNWIAEQL